MRVLLILLLLLPGLSSAQSVSLYGDRFDIAIDIAGNPHAQIGIVGGHNDVWHAGLALTITPFSWIYGRVSDGFRLDEGFAYERRAFRADVGLRWRGAFIERVHQFNSAQGNQQYFHIGVRLNLINMITE